MHSSAIPINTGRNGSSNVRFEIQAPPMPRLTNTNGPKQQADAASAARMPPANVVFANLFVSIGSKIKVDDDTIGAVP